ncbi:hypothetical protein DBR28_15810 [Chryseobacterium sp. HMWF028]|nr:hypothetical protein DBR28_15810 [Chryseobacterium sp. HMWF028]
MMKNKILLLVSTFGYLQLFSQIGVNTPNPQATLDVVGRPAAKTILDGIIAPRITGTQLRNKTYTINQTGALVYVTEADLAPADQTAEVTSSGYFYFDGNLNRWKKLSGGTAIGDPTADAFIDDPANGMVKLGSTSTGAVRPANSDFVIKDDGKVGIGTSDPDSSLHIKENLYQGSNQLKIESVNASPILSLEKTGSTNLSPGIELGKVSFNGKIAGSDWPLAGIKANYWGNGLTNSSSLTFSTSDRPAVLINESGDMGIGRVDATFAMSPTQKLDVDGNVRFRNVPTGTNLAVGESLMALESDGKGKKVPLEALGLVKLGVLAMRSGLQGFTNSDTYANIIYDQTPKLDPSLVTYNAGTGTFTIIKPGYYQILLYSSLDMSANADGATSGTAGSRILKNGSNTIARSSTGHQERTVNVYHSTVGLSYFNAGDTLVCQMTMTRRFRVDEGSMTITYMGN